MDEHYYIQLNLKVQGKLPSFPDDQDIIHTQIVETMLSLGKKVTYVYTSFTEEKEPISNKGKAKKEPNKKRTTHGTESVPLHAHKRGPTQKKSAIPNNRQHCKNEPPTPTRVSTRFRKPTKRE